MKRSLTYVSFVTAIALFSGCGSSRTTPAPPPVVDTTAPVFTNTTSLFTVVEGTIAVPVTLTTDDANAIFSEDSANAAISGSTLTFTAPLVNADTPFSVTVTARDAAGNSATKVFTFTVTDVPAAQNYAYVADIGDKDFNTTAETDILRGSSGLLWRDVDSAGDVGDLNRTAAITYCGLVGYRLPTRTELLYTLNYDQDHTQPADENNTLLDAQFINNADVSTVWTDSNNYYVHVVGGFDSLDNNLSAHRAVICVQGASEVDHNITEAGNIVTDNSTGYEWTIVDLDPANRDTFATAPGSCPVGFSLPNINDLRSIFNYTNNTLTEIVPAGNSISVWSSTENSKEADQYLIMDLNKPGLPIALADDTEIHYVTCVKKPTL